jgi:hypothetical protein
MFLQILFLRRTERIEFGQMKGWAINSAESSIWLRSAIIPYTWFENKLPRDTTGFRIFFLSEKVNRGILKSLSIRGFEFGSDMRYLAESDKID